MQSAGSIVLFQAPLTDDDAFATSRVLRAIADPVRLRMLSLIGAARDGETTVCALTDEFPLSQPAISHHLRILRQAGLVACRRRQTWVHYRVVPGTLDRVAHLFHPTTD